MSRFSSASPTALWTSEVTIAELYFGAYNSAKVEGNLKTVEAFARQLRIASWDRAASKRYGQVKANLRKAGRPIGDMDLLIAAVALVRDFTVVTNNDSEFAAVPGLKIENWSL